MKKILAPALVVSTLLFAIPEIMAQALVRDGELTLSGAEIELALSRAPDQVRRSVLADSASRYEFFVNLLVSKKIMASLDGLDSAGASETYLEYLFARLEMAREFDQAVFQKNLALPDFDALSRERYKISRDEIASVPEIRDASHILLLCPQGCDTAAAAIETLSSIRERILAGESFAELATEFSEDPGSKPRGGRLSRGIESDATQVDQSVKDALFGLAEVGEISGVVRSRFGFHIIKLEGVTPARIRSYEEVKGPLIAEIEKRYRQDAYRQHLLSFAPENSIEIDSEMFEQLVEEQ